MVIGGYNSNAVSLYDVELVSLDRISSPVPDCLTQLNQFPGFATSSAGALDYSGKSEF